MKVIIDSKELTQLLNDRAILHDLVLYVLDDDNCDNDILDEEKYDEEYVLANYEVVE